MSGRSIAAVIFDMDGVVVQTAGIHAAAWKAVFDDFLKRQSEGAGTPFVPFDADSDYRLYVDGKPRLDGVRAFLASRAISLPESGSGEPPVPDSVEGLGDRKNRAFLELLEGRGARPYPGTVALIDRLKAAGLKVALISASRNCAAIIEGAGLTGLFDARVDGIDSGRLGLAGKPAPDIFLEAARRLGVAPGEAAVVGDAIAGVEAGRRGGFGFVVGVDRTGHPDDLKANGADVVVSDLALLEPGDLGLGAPGSAPLPSALSAFPDIAACFRGLRPAVFLDYDGTLTPIVDRPDLAILDDAMRRRVEHLAGLCPVAVVSGRGLNDIRTMIGLEGLYYSGSHGFQIAGPGDWTRDYEPVAHIPAVVDSAVAELHERLDGIGGALIEPKRFSVAVHYRLVAQQDLDAVEAATDAVLASRPELKKGGGKKVFELRPDVAWDKGRAVTWLVETMGLSRDETVPIYLGDDTTDEDAFRALRGWGLGVVVLEDSRPTAADYALADPGEVGRFLDALAEEIGR